MNTAEIAELFNQYVDDADQTFMSDATRANFLNIAYREMAYKICEADSNIYVKSENYININSDTLSLSATPIAVGNKIMGAAPDTTRLYRLMRVSRSETNCFSTGMACILTYNVLHPYAPTGCWKVPGYQVVYLKN